MTHQEDRNALYNYIVGKTIGEGTFGKVKLAHHKTTGLKVAIKILEKNRIKEVADVERVTREIHILSKMRHPNIIQLHEIIETKTKLLIITEYAECGELFEHIVSNQRLKEEDACSFYLQLLAGIEYIHKLHVVHRDLKPENLLLDDKYNLKIIDFGLSNIYNESELLKTACGSPCYAAPEMIAGQKYKGLMVDIWSSGVILYAMLCGFLPFEDPNTTKLYNKILVGEFDMPEFLSPQAQDILKKVLTTDPNNRWTIDQLRNHEWSKKYNKPIEKGTHVGYDTIPIDMDIVEDMKNKYAEQNTGFVTKCLIAHKNNYQTTTYYLLKKIEKKPNTRKEISQSIEKHNTYNDSSDLRGSVASSNKKNRNANALNVSLENICSYKVQNSMNLKRGPHSYSKYRTLRDIKERDHSNPNGVAKSSLDRPLLPFEDAVVNEDRFSNVFDQFKDAKEFEYHQIQNDKKEKENSNQSYYIGNMAEVYCEKAVFSSKRGSSQGASVIRAVRSQASHYKPPTKPSAVNHSIIHQKLSEICSKVAKKANLKKEDSSFYMDIPNKSPTKMQFSPITIIQTPLINNINNYNNYQIANGKEVLNQSQIVDNNKNSSQFRRRKYVNREQL